MNCETMYNAVEAKKQTVLDAERYLWKNPEPGFREKKTHAYLKAQYEALGLTVHELDQIPASVAKKSAVNGEDRTFAWIPGFWVDFETGRPGPRLAIFGEMDSLVIPSHPECDPETGAVHACGHHCQSAALLGVAIGLSAPGALEGLSGSIRLIAVPAEELIELEFRRGLKEQGVIKYFGGKQELIYRGLLDDVDLAFMVHTAGGNKLNLNAGTNGCILKECSFLGRSAHAGGAPQRGINALYAANLALNAANALRETFVEKDYIRFHPIITNGGAAVNAIPDRVTVEAYVRGATMGAIEQANQKINRAFSGAAAAMGCGLEIHDTSGYAPRRNDPQFGEAFAQAAKDFLTEDQLNLKSPVWGTGCSDMGDVSCIMPAAHPSIGGSIGTGHGNDYFIADPVLATVVSAKLQLGAVAALLGNGAELAWDAVKNVKVPYASPQEYMEAVDRLNYEGQAVSYGYEDVITLRYHK